MLLIRVKPFSDESLAGYVLRAAAVNKMDQLTWIFLLCKKQFGYKIREEDLNWLDPSNLTDLSKIIGIPDHNLYSHTFECWSQIKGIPLGSERKSAWFLHHTTKLCSLCIEEKNYHRIWWSLTHATICPIHQIYLIDSCVNCGRPFRPRETVSKKCKCGSYITHSQTVKVNDDKVLAHQVIFQSFLNGSKGPKHLWIQTATDYFKGIEFLAKWIPLLTSLNELQSKQNTLQEKVTTRYRLKRNRAWYQSAFLYSIANRILMNWPDDYHSFLKEAETYSNKELNSFITFALPKLQRTSLEPFYREFNNLLVAEKTDLPTDTTLISEQEAIKILNLTKKNLHENLNIYIINITYGQREYRYINQNDLQTWNDLYANSLTQEELCKLWGLGKKTIQDLISSNFFESVSYKVVGAVTYWMIPQISIQSKMNKLRIISSDLQVKDTITLKKISQAYSRAAVIPILTACLNGDLPFTYSENISEIRVRRGEALIFAKQTILNRGKQTQYLSLEEVMFLLGVKLKDIIHWVNTGRFGSIVINDNSISYSGYEQFSSNFLTTTQISEKTGLSTKQILSRHKKGNITSISGPSHTDGDRLLFSAKLVDCNNGKCDLHTN
ncbi:hypothetical protein EEL31_18365 [Brevibacillus laterosporus]|nr:hypothetical protein EEL31_18365 [Brevibacillus laterosporus]